jgi:hypothetical protein
MKLERGGNNEVERNMRQMEGKDRERNIKEKRRKKED